MKYQEIYLFFFFCKFGKMSNEENYFCREKTDRDENIELQSAAKNFRNERKQGAEEVLLLNGRPYHSS